MVVIDFILIVAIWVEVFRRVCSILAYLNVHFVLDELLEGVGVFFASAAVVAVLDLDVLVHGFDQVNDIT